MPTVAYRLGNDVDVQAVTDVDEDSGLEGRPVDHLESMRKMLAAANLVVSAWDGETLVGVARSLRSASASTQGAGGVCRG